jgi:hypothetical protein
MAMIDNCYLLLSQQQQQQQQVVVVKISILMKIDEMDGVS